MGTQECLTGWRVPPVREDFLEEETGILLFCHACERLSSPKTSPQQVPLWHIFPRS